MPRNLDIVLLATFGLLCWLAVDKAQDIVRRHRRPPAVEEEPEPASCWDAWPDFRARRSEEQVSSPSPGGSVYSGPGPR